MITPLPLERREPAAKTQCVSQPQNIQAGNIEGHARHECRGAGRRFEAGLAARRCGRIPRRKRSIPNIFGLFHLVHDVFPFAVAIRILYSHIDSGEYAQIIEPALGLGHADGR